MLTLFIYQFYFQKQKFDKILFFSLIHLKKIVFKYYVIKNS